MTDGEKAVVVEVLCSQALADHLGDVRDAESKLWRLIEAEPLSSDDPAYFSDSPFRLAKARLAANGIALPSHLQGDDDDY